VRADVTLHVGSSEQEVIVTAERAHGEADALNRERARTMTASAAIGSDPQPAEREHGGRAGAVASVTLERDEAKEYVQIRGTEPRLTNVTLDGVNVASSEGGIRQIKLDTIPADLVESVEINKTLQGEPRRGRDWRVGEPGDEDGGRAANDCVQRHGRIDSDCGNAARGGGDGNFGTAARLAEAISARWWVVRTTGTGAGLMTLNLCRTRR